MIANMGKIIKPLLVVLFIVNIGILFSLMLGGSSVPVLDPKGLIATEQKRLLITATLLMLIVVIPVFVLTFFIAFKYRETNKKAKYSPDWDSNRLLELTWWAIPCAIILVLGTITWKSTHDLDPFRPIEASVKPLEVQVVAMDWKWLFIYPEQDVASVNFLQIPTDRPINFKITSDAPMNSFWIPQLGGQIYAMAGMSTKLHLIANEPGDYYGSSANISGKGFAGMNFIARAGTQAEFENWVTAVRQSSNTLGTDSYRDLSNPSEDNKVTVYSSVEQGLYDKIIMKYMAHGDGHIDGAYENTGHSQSTEEHEHN